MPALNFEKEDAAVMERINVVESQNGQNGPSDEADFKIIVKRWRETAYFVGMQVPKPLSRHVLCPYLHWPTSSADVETASSQFFKMGQGATCKSHSWGKTVISNVGMLEEHCGYRSIR